MPHSVIDPAAARRHPLRMSLAERLMEIDRLLQPVHLYLNTAAQGRLLDPAVADIRSVVMSVTKARDLLHELAEEPTQN
jgi:hypothetical protein